MLDITNETSRILAPISEINLQCFFLTYNVRIFELTYMAFASKETLQWLYLKQLPLMTSFN